MSTAVGAGGGEQRGWQWIRPLETESREWKGEFCGQMGISNLFLTVYNSVFFLFYRQSQVRGCLKPQNKFVLVTFDITETFEVVLNSFCMCYSYEIFRGVCMMNVLHTLMSSNTSSVAECSLHFWFTLSAAFTCSAILRCCCCCCFGLLVIPDYLSGVQGQNKLLLL